MSDYFFDIVIILVFLYEGIIMLTKKNGGHNRNSYTCVPFYNP